MRPRSGFTGRGLCLIMPRGPWTIEVNPSLYGGMSAILSLEAKGLLRALNARLCPAHRQMPRYSNPKRLSTDKYLSKVGVWGADMV